MKRSIATVCLSGTLDEKLDAAASAGFDGVELFEADLINSPLRPDEVRALADARGLTIDLYQPFRDFEAMPEPDFRRAEAKFDVMEALGAPTMLVCSNVSPHAIDDDALAAAQLLELASRADARGLKIAYEALAWGRHVSEYDHAWRIVERADHPALGTCLDSFHILSRGTSLDTIDAIPGEKIFYLQLADAPFLSMDVLQWSRHYRCFPGQGALDVRGLLARVLAAGYSGPLSLEVFNDVFRQADPCRTAIDAMRSLILLEDEPLPEPAALNGFAFVEIGVDSPEIEDLLRAMGFAHVGPHRSKPVQLFQHGEIRVVLNHGVGEDDPEVVAIAVDSSDPDASAARAEALLAPRVERRRGAGEADLTAVAAPDGTAVFFCGPDWLDDFLPTGEAESDGVPIERIDHITLAQPFEAFDEAGLFYRSVLALEPSASAELAAPDGLVRSRAYAAGDVRVVLNVPALASTRERSELQHVAFATSDALAAARAMRERGVPLLAVPDNYYDDLEARLGIDTAPLRELGVLYDRTPEGELLHFYTARLGGRVFFEVLERRGGYRGYGALNSPVRMAAQTGGERHAEGAGA
ncbi:sugar phosphate isomerase/epimerase and 4-hydroxyphenylpyruvate domain-containing protein [Solirubrobacter sp. CPCC 204708]|uniref:3-dehydroshikimate dehydratase n=1 Tax=Solirubrobacter deserti TaxID=2282478 RepID=A0ABT4RSM1_9ACTN|nr:sugar phosphate isomerase/epimerase and 4-hydroxyphenylpyruvate domain-containing protein [Solirubrobacter deserti]MBE2315914.1 sugar phosphate isomerase/epimerase and 4-hydroxyphenylpyruvate domain-containing protein [Solirubrobacter deserti]MDA0141593.1 sugar phosphate isomerase/epimerase and 4-hydroxyphenylpyruvate domain-containing protein [Solirubrobacter deserti]